MPAEAVPPPAEAVQPPETEAVSATPNRSRTDHPLPTLTNMNQRWYQWGTRGKEYRRQAAIASNCSHLRYIHLSVMASFRQTRFQSLSDGSELPMSCIVSRPGCHSAGAALLYMRGSIHMKLVEWPCDSLSISHITEVLVVE